METGAPVQGSKVVYAGHISAIAENRDKHHSDWEVVFKGRDGFIGAGTPAISSNCSGGCLDSS